MIASTEIMRKNREVFTKKLNILKGVDKKIQDHIAEKDNELMTLDLDVVQGYFELQDINKMCRVSAETEEEIQTTNSCEEHFQNIIKKLYVPSYQQENV